MQQQLVDPQKVTDGLRRVAAEIAQRDRDRPDLALVGIRRGGEPVAQHLARLIDAQRQGSVELGSIDITLYRDDAATALPSPRIGPSHIPFGVAGTRIVLVDDVLYTGRTIRAALEALLDYGRPRRIELAVVVDRGGRELPIQPDYCAARVQVADSYRVEVVPTTDGFEIVQADWPSGPGEGL